MSEAPFRTEGRFALPYPAAGRHGFHHVRTALRFTIDGLKLKDLEVIELGKRA